jgi:hypothetical protein
MDAREIAMSHADYESVRAGVTAANRRVILDALRAAGATRAVGEYSGSGDDGGFDSVDIEGASALPSVECVRIDSRREGDRWVYVTVPDVRPLQDVVEDFLGEYVDSHHGGWENGDGASGTVALDVATGVIRIDHESYYTASESYQTEETL